MKKVQILNSCLDCGHCEWIKGKPRCKHPETRLKEPRNDYDDGLLFPWCRTDGTKNFLDNCPLINIESEEKLKEIIDFYERLHDRIENFPWIVKIRKGIVKGD